VLRTTRVKNVILPQRARSGAAATEEKA
jgi:hypothetical protein